MERKCADEGLAQDSVNPNILRMLENTFSLDAAHMQFQINLSNIRVWVHYLICETL